MVINIAYERVTLTVDDLKVIIDLLKLEELFVKIHFKVDIDIKSDYVGVYILVNGTYIITEKMIKQEISNIHSQELLKCLSLRQMSNNIIGIIVTLIEMKFSKKWLIQTRFRKYFLDEKDK